MHDQSSEGNEFFKCDYCHNVWADDRPMVEGHQGALCCSHCLTIAYIDVVHAKCGDEHTNSKCVMCLEERPEAKWESPAYSGVLMCKRCIKQCAGVLEQDDEYQWKRPQPTTPSV